MDNKLRDLGFALMLFTIGLTQIIAADGDYTEFDKAMGLIVLVIGQMMVIAGVLSKDK